MSDEEIAYMIGVFVMTVWICIILYAFAWVLGLPASIVYFGVIA